MAAAAIRRDLRLPIATLESGRWRWGKRGLKARMRAGPPALPDTPLAGCLSERGVRQIFGTGVGLAPRSTVWLCRPTSTTPRRGPPQTTAARMGAPESSKQRLGHRGFDKHYVFPKSGPGAQPRRRSVTHTIPARRPNLPRPRPPYCNSVAPEQTRRTPPVPKICRTPVGALAATALIGVCYVAPGSSET